MNVMLAVPTRGQCNIHAMTSIFTHSVKYKCNFASVTGFLITSARNSLVKTFLASKCDYLFFVDDDVILPDDALPRLLALDTDIACGVYYGVIPVPCKDGKQHPRMRYTVQDFDDSYFGIHTTGVKEVKAGATGCMLIKREVLEVTRYPWFTWFENEDGSCIGEDISFCLEARSKGFNIKADFDCKCGHMKTMNLSMFPEVLDE